MSKITRGWPKLQEYAADYTEDVEKRVKQIVLETGQLIQSIAKASAPVDDGSLRDSISLKLLNGGFVAVVHVGTDYAIYVNYGTGIYAEGPGGSRAKKIPWTYFSSKLNRFVTTSGMKPQEFWEPAAEAGGRHFITEMGRL